MTTEAHDVEAERRGLMALAYRMLGTVADAEDAVQETYARWYRLTGADRAEIRNPAAWLTRVAGRVCLDALGSARRRREQYVGDWLPEPLPSAAVGGHGGARGPGADPLDRVTLDDTLSTALLIVLDALTPAERVAFVLHDVFGLRFTEIAEIVGRSPDACRQLAASARRHVQDRRRRTADRDRHDELVAAFAAACASGDLGALTAVLDPDVVLTSDGGGVVSAARRPVLGADRVGRFLLGLIRGNPDASVETSATADGTVLVARQAGAVTAVLTIGADQRGVTEVWIMRNPAKLTQWG